MTFINRIFGTFEQAPPKPTLNKRSSEWPKVEIAHLNLFPYCAVTGRLCFNVKTQKRILDCSVHHILPFHKFPELELIPTNLITLSEAGPWNAHFCFGHLLDWKSWNVDVVKMSSDFLNLIKNRP